MMALAEQIGPATAAGRLGPGQTIVARHGLRRRLMLVFTGFGLLVVIAAAIAILSLWMNQQSQDRIARTSIPIATVSLDLTRTAQAIVESVPRLTAVQTVEVQRAITGGLEREVEKLDHLLDTLRAYDIDPRAGASIDRSATQFSENIVTINRLVSARIAVNQSQAAQIAQAQDSVGLLRDVYEPLRPQLAEGLSRVLQADPQESARALRLGHALSQLDNLDLLLSFFAQADGARIDADGIGAIHAIEATLEDVPASQRHALINALPSLRDVFEGPDRVAQKQVFALQLSAAAEQALSENADLARRFDQAVNRMVEVAKADVELANHNAAAVQRTASWLLISVVGATLFSLVLIFRYYVHRNILARLTALTSSMMAIANGDLEANIPGGGNDELGSMAQALEVFRDTAAKVRESNLREIQEVRSRLHHAIENIQEGFALFDGDDALALCNQQFGQLLFHGVGVPPIGSSYSEVVQAMVRSEIIFCQDGPPEDWLDRALQDHENPEGMRQWKWSCRA